MTLKGLTFEGSNLEISHTTKGKRSTGLVQSVSVNNRYGVIRPNATWGGVAICRHQL